MQKGSDVGGRLVAPDPDRGRTCVGAFAPVRVRPLMRGPETT